MPPVEARKTTAVTTHASRPAVRTPRGDTATAPTMPPEVSDTIRFRPAEALRHPVRRGGAGLSRLFGDRRSPPFVMSGIADHTARAAAVRSRPTADGRFRGGRATASLSPGRGVQAWGSGAAGGWSNTH